jgi:glutamate synthase (ferredoxin)
VIDERGDFASRCNQDMVHLGPLRDLEEIEFVRQRIENHALFTRSARAARVLKDWDQFLAKFIRIIPKDYERVIEAMHKVSEAGLSGEDAIMAAFEQNAHDLARVGGG